MHLLAWLLPLPTCTPSTPPTHHRKHAHTLSHRRLPARLPCSGSWVRDFQSATEKLSYTDAAKSSGAPRMNRATCLRNQAVVGPGTMLALWMPGSGSWAALLVGSMPSPFLLYTTLQPPPSCPACLRWRGRRPAALPPTPSAALWPPSAPSRPGSRLPTSPATSGACEPDRKGLPGGCKHNALAAAASHSAMALLDSPPHCPHPARGENLSTWNAH